MERSGGEQPPKKISRNARRTRRTRRRPMALKESPEVLRASGRRVGEIIPVTGEATALESSCP